MERLRAMRRWWHDLRRESDQELDERFYKADGAARRLAINAVLVIVLGGIIGAALFLPDQVSRAALLVLISAWAIVLILGYALLYRIGMWWQGVAAGPSAIPATSVRQLIIVAPILLVVWIIVHLTLAHVEGQPMDWASLGGALVGFAIVYGMIFMTSRAGRRVPDSEASDDNHKQTTESN